MLTEVIITENTFRKEEFQTRTTLCEENGRKVVYKSAVTEKAKPFIKSIVRKEKVNVEYLKDYFDVHCGTLERDYIKYDYLPYPSLAKKMRLHMRNGNFQKAYQLLDEYVQKIWSLKTIETIPKEFLTSIVNDNNYNHKIICLARGLLDITPRNILIDGEHWIVVDNEWSFDFPVPTAFMLFRAIWETVIMLQSEIRQVTSSNNPSLGIFARGLNTYYVPALWANHLTRCDISLREMLRWEAGFRRYVTVTNKDYVGRIKKRPQMRTNFSSCSIISNSQVRRKMERFIKHLPGVHRLAHLLDI